MLTYKYLRDTYKEYGVFKFSIRALIHIYNYMKFCVFFPTLGVSYSQKGEDLVVNKLLSGKKKGFYIDIGANDPDRLSNTKKFYKRGWRGINIDPSKSCIEKFVKARPLDINLNVGIGVTKGKMNFFLFEPDVFSTFVQSEADNFLTQGKKMVATLDIDVVPLSRILSKYCIGKDGPLEIDFMSIDTEGMDFDVLKSNDWALFKPNVICVEKCRCGEVEKGDTIAKYLESLGYKKVFDNCLNFIWIRQ